MSAAGSESWSLNDLFRSHQEHTKPHPSEENCIALIDEMHETWCEFVHAANFVTWASQRLRIDLDDDKFTFDDLTKQHHMQVYAVIQLQSLCEPHGLLATNASAKEKLTQTLHVINDTRDSLFNVALVIHRQDPGRQAGLPLEKIAIENIVSHKDEKCTSFQNGILFILKELQGAEFRKCNEDCYKEVITPEGYRTHAWVKHVSIREFIYENVQKETSWEQWKNFTNPHNNPERIADHLASHTNMEFPALDVNRFLFSFRNGLYNLHDDMFYPFEIVVDGEPVAAQDRWKDMAAEIEAYRRDELGWTNYTCKAPSHLDVALKYFDQPFRFSITKETESNFDVSTVKLPEFESICNTQMLDAQTQNWLLIMMARLMYPVGMLDKWQVILFIKGVAGSGKSTLAQFVRQLFPPHLITTLSSNIEKQFGLSAIYKGLICICAEVRADFGLNQAEWQSAASGEEVQISEKHKTAFSHKWDTPMFFLGNETPNYKTTGGSVERRIFMVEFNEIVTQSDPMLFDNMIKNIDLFMRKSNYLYQHQVRLNGHLDVWCDRPRIVSDQIWKFHDNMKFDSIRNFLAEEDFEFNPLHVMPKQVLGRMYRQWCKTNGELAERFTKDKYATAFAMYSLVEVPHKETFVYGGVELHGFYVHGLQPRDQN